MSTYLQRMRPSVGFLEPKLKMKKNEHGCGWDSCLRHSAIHSERLICTGHGKARENGLPYYETKYLKSKQTVQLQMAKRARGPKNCTRDDGSQSVVRRTAANDQTELFLSRSTSNLQKNKVNERLAFEEKRCECGVELKRGSVLQRSIILTDSGERSLWCMVHIVLTSTVVIDEVLDQSRS